MDGPWFMWDVEVTEGELRERLRDPDPKIRTQWGGRILREATYPEVWQYLSLDEILRDWEHIQRHLGRRRAFWEWLIDGWRQDGLLSAEPPDAAAARAARRLLRTANGFLG